jgi:hypothetical protein
MTSEQPLPEDDDVADLRAWGEQLAGAMTSAEEPLCVARCFARPVKYRPRFTFQTWIDLEAIRSPLLDGRQFQSIEQISAAFSAFDLSVENLTGEEAALVEEELRAVIGEAFGMALEMSPPRLPGEQPPLEGPDGFGTWAPIMACLIFEGGVSPWEAAQAEVGRTLVLVAAHRRNQGWRAIGTPYALRGRSSESEGESESAAPETSLSTSTFHSVEEAR